MYTAFTQAVHSVQQSLMKIDWSKVGKRKEGASNPEIVDVIKKKVKEEIVLVIQKDSSDSQNEEKLGSGGNLIIRL